MTAPDFLPDSPPAWAPAMQEEVRRLVVRAGLRRALAPRCWVGHPGTEPDVDCIAVPDAWQGLRTDLVERAVDGLEHPVGALAWVTASGPLVAGDTALGWWAAARSGFARHGLEPAAFCLVNRVGWCDLAGGSGRTWTRVRPHRPPAVPGSEPQASQVWTGSLACISSR